MESVPSREPERSTDGNSSTRRRYGRPEDRERALAAGFIRHVIKPIDPQQLLDVIAEVVNNGAAI
jgi:hypothetical protein